MRFTVILLLISFSLLVNACQKEEQKQNLETVAATTGHKIIAEEVIQAGSYTYIKAKEGDQSYWLAVTKRDISEGATLYYAQGMEMQNFESKDLNRTFDTILFVDKISDRPMAMADANEITEAHAQTKNVEKEKISVAKAEGGISISQLYAGKSEFKDRIAIISGKVTKFNAGIMGRNWVHIQDGTEAGGKYDLTVTTKENVKVGDVVTFSGRIALDKDFGAGYAYEVIMENATVLN